MYVNSLGGSIFTHNVLKYDYCIEAAVDSLLYFCDKVVVLDASSTDGTLELLEEMASRNKHLSIVKGAMWDEYGRGNVRHRDLANAAQTHLGTRWHFMGQADEVVHEKSAPIIRRICEKGGYGWHTFYCRRWNFFIDFDHYVALDSPEKPCSDRPVRLGLNGIQALAGAESLMRVDITDRFESEIEIYHYGMVRKFDVLIDKTIDMQTWYHGADGVDKRALDLRASGEKDPYRFMGEKTLTMFNGTHPKFAEKWLRERQAEKDAFSVK